MLRKEKINFRKANILGMYAIDLSTARPKWRQTPVTAYICLYQELNLKLDPIFIKKHSTHDIQSQIFLKKLRARFARAFLGSFQHLLI